MKQQRSQRKGFTLIEMLVVIAIIALLASILVPAVTGALAKADRTTYTSYAKGLYLDIFATRADNVMARNRKNYFPNTASINDGDYADSSEFFQFLMEEGVIVEDFEVFGGLPGMSYATQPSELSSSTNPWSVTINVNSSTPPSLPFIFTANVDANPLVAGNNNNSELTIDASLVQMEDVIILVNVGGGTGSLVSNKQDDADTEEVLVWSNFNPTSRTNAVLQP